MNLIELIGTFVAAWLCASLVEYWGHRLMHKFPQLCQFHVEHHHDGTGQGVLKEFRDYAIGGLPILLLSVLLLTLAGVSWATTSSWLIGCFAYTGFAAYAHQLQHDRADLCFWMPMPVHYIHHHHNQWHHNFGIGVDLWDRLFGTYQFIEWQPETESEPVPSGYLRIRWW